MSGCAGGRATRDVAPATWVSTTRTAAVAAFVGEAEQHPQLSSAFAQRLELEGVRAVCLEAADPVLAASVLTLKTGPQRRLLQEIRRVTGAESVILLEMEASRRAIGVTVWDTRSALRLHEERTPSGGAPFKSQEAAASAASAAVSNLFKARRPLSSDSPERESDGAEGSTFGIGVNVLGGQLSYQPTSATRAELRYQTGKNGSGADRVTSSIAGLRGYRLFWIGNATRPYLGLEAAYVATKESAGGRALTGAAGGAFIGFERRLLSRLWIGIDAGPYLVHLREKTSGTKDTSLEFVANTSLSLRLF